jgi:hypothetical protein
MDVVQLFAWILYRSKTLAGGEPSEGCCTHCHWQCGPALPDAVDQLMVPGTSGLRIKCIHILF